jgi:poly-D-alanine transfer protein DltD
LNIRVKDATDDAETTRYQNSQLQRELKSAREQTSREMQKFSAEVKVKDDENRLLYTRLDEMVKQLTEKESKENKFRFMEQQISNQNGTINELRDRLEGALERANIVI